MLRLIAGLSRSLPLVIALAVIALVAYLVISWRRSPERAKEILIKVFFVVCSVIAIAFALIALYAILDQNTAVLELAASFSVVGIVGVIIVAICRYFFKKHHPHYAFTPNVDAKPIENKPDLLNIVTKILNVINDSRRR